MDNYATSKQALRKYDDESYENDDDDVSFETEDNEARDKSQIYPSNIAAACQQASVAFRQPKSNLTEDALKLEKRRKSNRLSAQRWRMRKRSKFSDLQDKIRTLQKDQEELQHEKAKLHAELQIQLALAKAETAHLSPAYVAARLGRSDEALCLSQRLYVESANKVEGCAAGHSGCSQGFPMMPSYPPATNVMASLRASSSMLRAENHVKLGIAPHQSMFIQRSNPLLNTLMNPLVGKGVSMAELRDMLRTATA